MKSELQYRVEALELILERVLNLVETKQLSISDITSARTVLNMGRLTVKE